MIEYGIYFRNGSISEYLWEVMADSPEEALANYLAMEGADPRANYADPQS